MYINFNEIIDNSRIIDLRPSFEYNEFNISGSKNIPKFILLNKPDKYLNKTDTYYLICNKGEVSLSTAKILNALGYNCYSIIGGIDSLKTI